MTAADDLPNVRLPHGKGRRRKMRAFKLDEISVVDRPAQEGAVATLMKRRPLPLADMRIDYDRAIADVRRLRKRGLHARANELQQALALHGATTLMKQTGDYVVSIYDPPHIRALNKARERPKTVPIADLLLEEMEQEEDELEEDEAAERLEALLDEPELDEDDDEFELVDTDELDDVLDAEIRETKQDSDPSDEETLFEDDTEVGRIANGLMRRDPRMSKRMALYQAAGRVAAKRGIYAKRYERVAKVASTITTDSGEPFHQERGAERRALMDRRANQSRDAANAEIAAMREHFTMGREREEARRAIDSLVTKLRQVDPRMPYQEAIRKVRAQYPRLF